MQSFVVLLRCVDYVLFNPGLAVVTVPKGLAVVVVI